MSAADDVEKVELHCHLDGLVDRPMLEALAARGHRTEVDLAAVDRSVPVRSMDGWLREYTPLVEPAMAPVDRFVPILEIHVENLIRQRVVYAEIMVSRLLLLPGGEAEMVQRFEALRAAADRASGDRTEIRFLVAIGRGSIERTERQAARILRLARTGLVVGVAIAGDENACTIRSLVPFIDRFRDAGLQIEIHAGEMAGPESVWDAIEHGHPDRLGHGTRAFEDPRLVDRIGELGLHLELCPTSNVCLGVIPSFEHHPIARARDLGLSFSVNTDDPGPFGCTLTSELRLLEGIGFRRADFDRIRTDAMAARFGPR
jgi:adenosine deaminase